MERFIHVEVPVERIVEVPVEKPTPSAASAGDAGLRAQNDALAARLKALEAEHAAAAEEARSQRARADSLAAELVAARGGGAAAAPGGAGAEEAEQLRRQVALLEAELQRSRTPVSPDAWAAHRHADADAASLASRETAADGATSPTGRVSPLGRRNKWSGRRAPLSTQ